MSEERRPLVVFLYVLASRIAALGELERALATATAATPPFLFDGEHAAAWARHAADELERAAARAATPKPGEVAGPP